MEGRLVGSGATNGALGLWGRGWLRELLGGSSLPQPRAGASVVLAEGGRRGPLRALRRRRVALFDAGGGLEADDPLGGRERRGDGRGGRRHVYKINF